MSEYLTYLIAAGLGAIFIDIFLDVFRIMNQATLETKLTMIHNDITLIRAEVNGKMKLLLEATYTMTEAAGHKAGYERRKSEEK